MSAQLSIVYKTLDMWLEISDYVLSDDEIEVIDFTIELDYVITKDKPSPLDYFACMVMGMLADGTHLQKKILDCAMQDNDVYCNIYEECTKDAYEEHRSNIDGYADYLYSLKKDNV